MIVHNYSQGFQSETSRNICVGKCPIRFLIPALHKSAAKEVFRSRFGKMGKLLAHAVFVKKNSGNRSQNSEVGGYAADVLRIPCLTSLSLDSAGGMPTATRTAAVIQRLRQGVDIWAHGDFGFPIADFRLKVKRFEISEFDM
jgi:hypothetical protein